MLPFKSCIFSIFRLFTFDVSMYYSSRWCSVKWNSVIGQFFCFNCSGTMKVSTWVYDRRMVLCEFFWFHDCRLIGSNDSEVIIWLHRVDASQYLHLMDLLRWQLRCLAMNNTLWRISSNHVSASPYHNLKTVFWAACSFLVALSIKKSFP